MSKKILIILFLMFLPGCALNGYSLDFEAQYVPEEKEKVVPVNSIGEDVEVEAELANPASVYCKEQGGELEIRKGKAGGFGVCIFDDGSRCEEWSFFRGDCEKGQIK